MAGPAASRRSRGRGPDLARDTGLDLIQEKKIMNLCKIFKFLNYKIIILDDCQC